MNNFDLDDECNYNKTFNCDIEIAFFKYTVIIEEFIYCSKKMEMSTYYKYILIKGIENIYHVFNMLLLYTKNIDAAYYHTKKAFLYYYEFVEQIKDDNNKLLNLNIKDATVFIYKKILYNVKTNCTSISDIEQKNILTLDKIIMFYNNILSNTIITNKSIKYKISSPIIKNFGNT